MRSPATAALPLLVLVVVLVLVPAAPARGDGLPVLGVDAGLTGVAGGGLRYVTIGAGARSTTVATVRREGGQVLNAAALRGAFTIPAVALDGSPSGLSADGRTLVLIRPRARFPQRRTVLALLDVPSLRVRRILRLRGDYSFDAIAPDGRALYLIQYVSRSDPTRYRVRAYDVRAGRLVAALVVDPRERGEKMRGLPLSRATSADGRWAYTLYDGGGGEPFIHALDTRARTAVCVDLPQLAGRGDLSSLRMVRHRGLTVMSRRGPVVQVDTRTFAVTRPAPARALRPATPARDARIPWAPVTGALLAAGALAAGALRRRRRVALAALRAR